LCGNNEHSAGRAAGTIKRMCKEAKAYVQRG
jgi:hypothetical protein